MATDHQLYLSGSKLITYMEIGLQPIVRFFSYWVAEGVSDIIAPGMQARAIAFAELTKDTAVVQFDLSEWGRFNNHILYSGTNQSNKREVTDEKKQDGTLIELEIPLRDDLFPFEIVSWQAATLVRRWEEDTKEEHMPPSYQSWLESELVEQTFEGFDFLESVEYTLKPARDELPDKLYPLDKWLQDTFGPGILDTRALYPDTRIIRYSEVQVELPDSHGVVPVAMKLLDPNAPARVRLYLGTKESITRLRHILVDYSTRADDIYGCFEET